MNGEQAIGARTPASVRLWRNRDFVLLEGGQQVSALGSSISGLAFLLLTLDLTHSPAQAGFITGLEALPFLALAPNVVVLGVITAGIYAADCVGSIINTGYRLALTPDAYQGRANSLHQVVGFGVGRPAGLIVAGLLLQRFDPRVAIAAFASLLGLMALAASLYRPMRLAPRLS